MKNIKKKIKIKTQLSENYKEKEKGESEQSTVYNLQLQR